MLTFKEFQQQKKDWLVLYPIMHGFFYCLLIFPAILFEIHREKLVVNLTPIQVLGMFNFIYLFGCIVGHYIINWDIKRDYKKLMKNDS